MPKNRYIDTKFWSDGYVVTLNPLERYLFMYFLTNEHTIISGIYELPIRVIAFESGLDESVLPAMLKKFQDDKKIFYIDEWVIVCNFPKHQEAEKSPKIRQGILNALKLLPSKIRYTMDTLSIPYAYPSNYYNSNTNSNKNNISSLSASELSSVEDSYFPDSSDGETPIKKPNLLKAYKEILKRAVEIRSKYQDKPYTIVKVQSQFKALKEMREVGIRSDEIITKWREMCESDFWMDRGFDMHTVAAQLGKKR